MQGCHRQHKWLVGRRLQAPVPLGTGRGIPKGTHTMGMAKKQLKKNAICNFHPLGCMCDKAAPMAVQYSE